MLMGHSEPWGFNYCTSHHPKQEAAFTQIVVFLTKSGIMLCRCQVCCSPHQHKTGWALKVAHPVLLLRELLEWIFLSTNILMYKSSALFLANYYFCCIFFSAASDIHLLLQYNFVGRLLGPRGNSLKRVEASTDCRVLIRGRGSIKDPAKVFMIFPP